MPIFFLFFGILLMASAVNNKQSDLNGLLAKAFTSTDKVVPFHIWVLAIVIIGSLGYIKELRPISTAFMILIVAILVLRNGGVFTQFQSAIKGKSNE